MGRSGPWTIPFPMPNPGGAHLGQSRMPAPASGAAQDMAPAGCPDEADPKLYSPCCSLELVPRLQCLPGQGPGLCHLLRCRGHGHGGWHQRHSQGPTLVGGAAWDLTPIDYPACCQTQAALPALFTGAMSWAVLATLLIEGCRDQQHG